MKNKLKYQFYRFLSTLTFGKLKLKMLNKKNKYKNLTFQNVDNHICDYGYNNQYDKTKIVQNKILLNIYGNNNSIELRFSEIGGLNKNLTINIYGNNNKLVIGSNFKVHNDFHIDFAYPPHCINNSEVSIGKDFSIVSGEIMLLENSSKCLIGDSCMFSEQVIIRLSDTHSVLDLNGKLLNYGGLVEIGNHVWCGREVRILKNVSIRSDSIIGANAIVTKRFNETNVAIAGNPAKIIKRNINWSGLSPQQYLEQKDNYSEERKKERKNNLLL